MNNRYHNSCNKVDTDRSSSSDSGVLFGRVIANLTSICIRIIALSSLAMGLSACSLLTVKLDGPKESECNLANNKSMSKSINQHEKNPDNCTVGKALLYAADWRQEFMSAAGHHSVARNMNALIGFPAGAVALFYGLSGHGSSDRISRLGIGAGTYYSASSFLGPKGKQRAYLEGSLALSCLIDAGIGYRVNGDRLGDLEEKLEAVIEAKQKLDETLGQLNVLGDTHIYNTARIAAVNASNAIDEARRLRNMHANAGLRLAGAVDRIVIQTAQLVTSQESGLDSLLSMAGNLRQTSMSFGLSAQELGNQVEPKGESDNNTINLAYDTRRKLYALNKKTNNLEEAVSELLAAIDALAVPQDQSDAFDICAPATAFSGFSVSPHEAAQTVKAGKSIAFRITNVQSNAYPTWRLLGPNADAVEVDGPKVQGGQLVLEVKGKSVTGSTPTVLVITDPTGALSKRYTIAVLADPASPLKSFGPSGKGSDESAFNSAELAGFAAGRTKNEIKTLQCNLGLVGEQNDGIFGPITYSALMRFARSNDLNMGDRLTEAVIDQVVEEGTNHCEQADFVDD